MQLANYRKRMRFLQTSLVAGLAYSLADGIDTVDVVAENIVGRSQNLPITVTGFTTPDDQTDFEPAPNTSGVRFLHRPAEPPS